MKVILTLFHIVSYHFAQNKAIILEDVEAWYKNYLLEGKPSFVYLLIKFPAFRSVFSYRIRKEGRFYLKLMIIIADFLLKKQVSLYISTNSIKGGLFFLHGFSTIVSAKSIGRNCWINQQVTIGYTTPTGAPIIKDNVRIYAGAKVLGNIIIGNNVIIGANAVVVKDVPDNCTVVGVPAYVISKDGIKVHIKL